MANEDTVLLHKALSYLNRREYHRTELKAKLLTTKGGKTNDVEAVLDRLESEGILSDLRYIEAFVASRQAKLYGPIRIKMELQQKKLDTEIVNRILEAANMDWFNNARLCLRKKFPQPPVNNSELAKRQNFLWRRGYPEAMIRRLLTTDHDE